MQGVLIDSNVILDLFFDDPVRAQWSESILDKFSRHTRLFINPIVYAEVSIGFTTIEAFEKAMTQAGFLMLELPKEALFLAGKAFLQYRKKSGTKRSPLSDFYIGAQAAVFGMDLITRDVSRYGTYFPTVTLITPGTMG